MKNTSKTIIVALVCFFAVVGVANAERVSAKSSVGIDPANPPIGVFIDEWYAVMINGKKCGQMRTRMARIESEGIDQIESQTKMRMRVRRGQAELSIGIAQKTIETLEGQPVQFSRTMYLGQSPVVTEGTVRKGKVTITTTQFGQKLPAKIYDMPDGAMMEWGLYREQFKRGLKPGTQYDLKIYEPTIAPDRACPTAIEIIGPETVDLFGRKVDAVKTSQIMRIPHLLGAETEQKSVAWVTQIGQVIRLEMSLMDIPIQILACSKAVAMAEDDPAELMIDMLVPLARPIDADHAQKITYRIRLKRPGNKTKLPEIPETDMQSVVSHKPGEITVSVSRLSSRNRKSSADTLTPEDRKRYLAATTSVNTRDPEIIALADKAAGDEKDPRRLAEKLCRFISDYVYNKSLNVGFATASEVARSREGDCTEHGLLLAALGRAKGIPTRIVTGLVYADEFAGRRNVLGGHLWTQFWIDGVWVDLDAAYGQTDVDPTHIALGISTAGDEGLADLVTTTWLSLGKLAISVEYVEPK